MTMRVAIRIVVLWAWLAPEMVALAAIPEKYTEWTGWIIGKPCVGSLKIQDCPLTHIDTPVLLLENGTALAFAYGKGSAIRDVDVDKNYGKKVRVTGELKDNAIRPIRLDALEKSGERKFFKGCL